MSKVKGLCNKEHVKDSGKNLLVERLLQPIKDVEPNLTLMNILWYVTVSSHKLIL